MQQNVASAIASGLKMVPCPHCKKRHLLQRKDIDHHLETIAARTAQTSTKTKGVDKETAVRVLVDRKKGLKKVKKIKSLPAIKMPESISAAPKDTPKPKAQQPKVRTTPRNSVNPVETLELVSESMPVGWMNPELPPAGTFEALASIRL